MIKLLIAIVTLSAGVFAWWVKNDAEKKKNRKETDDEIDNANNAQSLLRIFDRLRNRK